MENATANTSEFVYDEMTEKELLTKLSAKTAELFLPVSIFLGLMVVIGALGNALVLIIYAHRHNRNMSGYFIITMAIYDSLACCTVIPIDIYDVVNHYTFYSSAGCKVFRFMENIVTSGSSFVLIAIAYDRYRKICRPLTTVTRRNVKLLCAFTFLLAIVFSIPAPILFGTKRSRTAIKGLKGYDCSIEEQHRNSLLRKIYYPLLILIFLLTLCLLVGFYIRIWVEIKRRKRTSIGENSSGSGIQINVDVNNHVKYERNNSIQRQGSLSDDSNSVFSNRIQFHRSISQASTRSRLASVTEALKRAKPSKTTKIFALVAFIFVLSFLPTISVQLAFLLDKSLAKAPKSVLVLLKFLSRSHYVNNVSNPIIYSFMNINFRKDCRKLWSDIISCHKRIRVFERRKSLSTRSSFRKRSGVSKTDSLKSNPKSDCLNSSSQTNELKLDVVVPPPKL